MTPAEPPYDLPHLKALTQSLCQLLHDAAQGISQPDQRRELNEAADSFQRIAQDFEAEYGKLDAAAAAKAAEAQKKMGQAEAAIRAVEDKARQAEMPAIAAEPDWSLGPKLRDELLGRRMVAPPPLTIDPSGSLAPWALSPEPMPAVAKHTPVSPPAHTPAPHVAQSVASWLSDSPPVPVQPPASAAPTPDASHGSIVSWMFSPEPPAGPAARGQEEWKESMKQWLAKPRGAAADANRRE